MAAGERIPVNVITGFLGSGKTTLLQRLLRSPSLQNTAVLVNELGEIGLDHHLLQNAVTPTLLLENGCLCCAIRGDLKEALRDLFDRRERGAIPAFTRVIIETSGLADPAPIAYTVLAEPVLQHHFRLGSVITVVDAVNGLEQLAKFEESVKQVAVADRLVLTKTDLAHADQLTQLRKRLIELNLSAPIVDTALELPDPGDLIIQDIHDAAGKALEAGRWVVAARETALDHRHTSDVTSFALVFDQPMDWTAFGVWMTMLLNRYGDKVLRIKGILNVAGVPTPVLINGVQHIVHPPVHLPAWPDADQRSRLVFIVHGLERERIAVSLAAFNRLANPTASTVTPTAKAVENAG
ncbi:MAG: CobW family GTP-binding protein [Burkholderiales bacterium]